MNEKLKQTVEKLKAFESKFSKKTKRTALVLTVLIIGGAVAIATVLNKKEYTILYSELNDSDVQTILSKLKDTGVDYQYKSNGTILVDEKSVDQVRVQLAEEGYPKDGFAYDTFINNTGGMTTDSAEQTYKLYQIQDRLGAEIKLFSGVKDAKVNIALAQEQKYVLQDNEDAQKASASVVVIMKEGETLSQKQATAIQRLVAKSIRNLAMSDVAVIDGDGIVVSTDTGEDGTGSNNTAQELATMLEQQIEKNIVNVLTPIYGQGNVRVSAKGTFNMEKLIRETITYNTPEKIDENDKTGIVSKENTSSSQSSSENTPSSGTPGTSSNSDVPQYNTDSNSGNNQQSENQAAEKDFLVNQTKEQGQIDSGVLEDLRVSVAINGNDYGLLQQEEVIALIGNAAGMPNKSWNNKISIVAAPFYDTQQDANGNTTEDGNGNNTEVTKINIPWLIVGPIAGVLVLLLIIFLIIRKRRKKKQALLEEAELSAELSEELEEAKRALDAERLAMEKQKELYEHQSARSQELRDNVQEFAQQNPEISAQMLKIWLSGGDDDGES